MPQIYAGFLERRLLDLDHGLGLVQIRGGFVVVRIRYQVCLEEVRRAVGVDLGEFQPSPRIVQLRDHLVGFDQRIEIREEFLDVAGDLAAELNVKDGIQLAVGGYGLGQVPARDQCRLILRRVGVVLAEIPDPGNNGRGQDNQNHQPLPPAGFPMICHNVSANRRRFRSDSQCN